MGEIIAQYVGLAPDAPVLEPYWVLAEELDARSGFLLSPALGALGGYLWEWRQTTNRVTPAPA